MKKGDKKLRIFAKVTSISLSIALIAYWGSGELARFSALIAALSSTESEIQVFFDHGEGFNENDSMRLNLLPNKITSLNFGSERGGKVYGFRIDFGFSLRHEIRNLSIAYSLLNIIIYEHKFAISDWNSWIAGNHNINIRVGSGSDINVTTNGEDPYFIVSYDYQTFYKGFHSKFVRLRLIFSAIACLLTILIFAGINKRRTLLLNRLIAIRKRALNIIFQIGQNLTRPMRLASTFILFFGFFALFRYILSDYSFAGRESDYGVHYFLVNLLQTDFKTVFLNAPYRGIIGSHLAAAFVALFCNSTALSMLIVSDICLLLTFGFVLYLVRHSKFEFGIIILACFIIVSLRFFSASYHAGAYAQATSEGLYSLSIVLYLEALLRRDKRLFFASLFILFASAIFYPDAIIWIFPVYILSSDNFISFRNRIIRSICVLISFLLVLPLAFGQLFVMVHDGGLPNWGWKEFFITFSVLITLFFGINLFQRWRGFAKLPRNESIFLARLVLLYFAYCIITSIFSFIEYNAVLYYARKNYYFLAVYFPLAIYAVGRIIPNKVRIIGFLLFSCIVLFTLRLDLQVSNYKDILAPSGAYSRDDERKARLLVKKYKERSIDKIIIFSPYNDELGIRLATLLCNNSIAGTIKPKGKGYELTINGHEYGDWWNTGLNYPNESRLEYRVVYLKGNAFAEVSAPKNF